MMSFARPSPTSRASRWVPPLTGNHAEVELRQGKLGSFLGDPEIAGERELEADAECVAVQQRDHGLRAALGCRDVPGEPRDFLRRSVQEALDVAAGGEGAALAAQDDRAHALVPAELFEELAQPVAGGHRDAVQLLRSVERDRRDAVLLVAAEQQAVCIGHAFTSWSRSSRRRIFPTGSWAASRRSGTREDA